ncbi:MAG TPA: glucose-1-phosphate adenylyltransferase, partial [Rhabdochlamydiaceae bacterium]
PHACKTGKTACFLYDGYWEDIGTIASYYNASLALIEQDRCLNTYDEKNPIRQEPDFLPSPKIKNTRIIDSLIGDGSLIEAEEIAHSVLGVRSVIKKGTIIRDSIVLGNTSYKPAFSIGKNCLIQKAIIDQHTTIGNNVQLVNQKNVSTFDGNGIYIRDGIIIVTTGAQLPDGFVL